MVYNVGMNQYDPRKHHRRSICVKGWDYRSPGLYFVTICTFQRRNTFVNQRYCDLAQNGLVQIPNQKHAQHVALDEWIVMPNHVHVIFDFVEFAVQAELTKQQEYFENALAGSLGVVVGQYKSAVTRKINVLRKSKGAPVWQRGYWEHIIRNERELLATREYIINNPLRWAEDRENLDALLEKMTFRG